MAVYLAAGVSGLTAIVGTFFVKEQLGLSATFLAALGFWAGIPWTLKMPLGHLVDLIWRWKGVLVVLGAAFITFSMLVMYALVANPNFITGLASAEAWYVVANLAAPVGYVLQDVVADAMTVEAVPTIDECGRPYPEDRIKAMHTTMQTLGRVAMIFGLIVVAVLNIAAFSGVAGMSDSEKTQAYADIYLMGLAIPAISVIGVALGALQRRAERRRLAGLARRREIEKASESAGERVHPDWRLLGGGLAFVAFTLFMGLVVIPFSQEIVFAGSLLIVGLLIRQLLREIPAPTRKALVGTAIIIFAFRAAPLPGPAVTWWQIDQLGFDQQFLSVLTLITSGLTLAGMLLLRPFMAARSVANIVVWLSVVSGVLALPNIGLFYGIHEWTARLTGGVADARFIAIVNTALESPLGQISMIPLLTWIAKNAPARLKATYFAVMASFTNLALSASSLGTKYLNLFVVVQREVHDSVSGAIVIPANYSQIGFLLIVCVTISVALPLAIVVVIQASPLRTRQ